jgi:hypothetical protein
LGNDEFIGEYTGSINSTLYLLAFDKLPYRLSGIRLNDADYYCKDGNTSTTTSKDTSSLVRKPHLSQRFINIMRRMNHKTS